MARLSREAARARIIDAANAASERRRYSMRHIQQAVFHCRQRKLVTPLTLERAGFRATRAR